MIRDMGLDQELAELKGDINSEVTTELLDGIRAYLSWFYAASKYAFYWNYIYCGNVDLQRILAS